MSLFYLIFLCSSFCSVWYVELLEEKLKLLLRWRLILR